jgi:hypothetical protein
MNKNTMNKNTVIIDNFNLDVKLPDGSITPVSDLSYDDISLVKAHLEEKMSNIRTQLKEAEGDVAVDGIYADRDWYRSARHALTVMQRQAKVLQFTLAKRKRTRALAIDSCFVELCRERVESDAFWGMMDEAIAMHEERVG